MPWMTPVLSRFMPDSRHRMRSRPGLVLRKTPSTSASNVSILTPLTTLLPCPFMPALTSSTFQYVSGFGRAGNGGCAWTKEAARKANAVMANERFISALQRSQEQRGYVWIVPERAEWEQWRDWELAMDCFRGREGEPPAEPRPREKRNVQSGCTARQEVRPPGPNPAIERLN